MRQFFSQVFTACVMVAGVGICAPALASDALIAVATNFKATMDDLEADFEATSDYHITTTTGSTGKLYAQIVNGAPYDAWLAADQITPERLARAGRSVPGSRFTYAVGRLVVWSLQADRLSGDGEVVLRGGDFRKLAMANPKLAPYGRAAEEVLVSLGLSETLRPKRVMGENVGQAFALVATGNAELGFVAASFLHGSQAITGSYWAVPQSLHAPIRQDAVLLSPNNAAASAFMDYLQSPAAKVIMDRYGYGTAVE